MLKYIIIGLLISIGWHIGKIIAFETRDAIHNYIANSKLKQNSDAKVKHVNNQPYKGTKMGF